MLIFFKGIEEKLPEFECNHRRFQIASATLKRKSRRNVTQISTVLQINSN